MDYAVIAALEKMDHWQKRIFVDGDSEEKQYFVTEILLSPKMV